MKHPANLLTYIRLLTAPALLFVPVFSPAFYGLYLPAGLTDMLDGPVARHTHTQSSAGVRLDSLADLALPGSACSGSCPCCTLPAG